LTPSQLLGVVITSRARFCGSVILCAWAIAVAQQLGSIEGIVTDATGAGIGGAEVALSDRQSGFERKATADARGAYRFAVPIGTYQLSVSSPGFQKHVSDDQDWWGRRSRGTPRIPASGIRKRSAKFNTEEYDDFEEKDFAEARRSPLSTFGADVDTASYSNVRRFLRQRKLPPAGSCCGNRDLAVRQASIT